MKINQLKVQGDTSLISKDDLWEMECSQVKPYHFGLFIRKHNKLFATIQAQRVLSAMQEKLYLVGYRLPPIYRCTIDELPFYSDLPKEQQVSVIENMIPVDAKGDLEAFKLLIQNCSESAPESQLQTYQPDT